MTCLRLAGQTQLRGAVGYVARASHPLARWLVLTNAAVLICAAPCQALPQASGKLLRIGMLAMEPAWQVSGALEKRWRELGLVPGEGVTLVYRLVDEPVEQQAAAMAEQRVDIILTMGDQNVRAADAAAPKIPVVMVACDAIAAGLVTSLANPAGHITGLTCNSAEIAAKRVELLREAIPGLSKIAVLYNGAAPGKQLEWRLTEVAASSLGVSVQACAVSKFSDFDGAFTAMARDKVDGLVVLGDYLTSVHNDRIAELAYAQRLPSVHAYRL